MVIYLVRHGETDWNKAGRIQGQVDIPLNEYGRELAEKTREGLKDIPFDAAFCSPLIRARETAEIILRGRDIPLICDERIKEVGFGPLEGETIEEVKMRPDHSCYDFFVHPERYHAPEGAESLEALFARSAQFMAEVIRPLEGKAENVLVTAHGALNRSIINPLEQLSFAEFWQEPMKNCAVSRIELLDGKFRLLERNHLYY